MQVNVPEEVGDLCAGGKTANGNEKECKNGVSHLDFLLLFL